MYENEIIYKTMYNTINWVFIIFKYLLFLTIKCAKTVVNSLLINLFSSKLSCLIYLKLICIK
jgi:hypothetical protein